MIHAQHTSTIVIRTGGETGHPSTLRGIRPIAIATSP